MAINFPKITDFPVLNSLSEKYPKVEIFLVGGAVRDTLLGKKITDIDMLVRNITGEELEEFLASKGRVIFAGRNFGVWKFNEIGKPNNEIYDIALPRTEFSMHKQGVYSDFRIKTDPKLPIEEDLSRRDFTINAMAYNLATEELIDLYDGQKDLKKKIIRTVGKPKERFQEDYSRILRAIRFSLQLDFSIEKKTLDTIKIIAPSINNEIDGKRILPHEVISEEFLKSLIANAPKTLDLWDETGVLVEVLPELLKMKGCAQPKKWHTEGDVWNHTRIALEVLSTKEFKNEFPKEKVDLELIITTLFHDIGKPYTITTPEKDNADRVRFNNHDAVGAKITREALERIKISAPEGIGVDPSGISWIIENHMLLVHGEPSTLKPNTIEKYFFNPNKPSRNLMKLMFVDGLATIGPDGKGFRNKFDDLCRRIAEIKKVTKSHGQKLAKPLVNGKDIMKILKINGGEDVGNILENVRQLQLSGKLKSRNDATEYLKKIYENNHKNN
jgi:putative nucleotidyltransferase with HDIG domain